MSVSRLRIAWALAGLLCARAALAQLPIVNGWTQFAPSPDSRLVYVSSSAGDDLNDGLTPAAPKRTIAAGYELIRDGFPDWLLLKSGDTWQGNGVIPDWTKGGRSANEPSRIGSYGQGPRPRILTGNQNGFYTIAIEPKAHLAITDLHLIADGYDGINSAPGGIEVLASWSDVLIENCLAERYMDNLVIQADPATQSMTGIRVRRCVFTDSYRVLDINLHPQGAYIAGVNGILLEECLFDHNGWSETIPGANPTIFRHNLYIQSNCTNVTTRRLISARAGATGMQQRSGGLCEGHLFLQNPLNIVFGFGGTVRHCVVLDSRDIDANTPRGVGIQLSSGSDHEAYGNICAWRTTPATWNVVGISIDHGTSTVNVHDNIVWKWWSPDTPGATGIGIEGQPSPPIAFRRNAVQMVTGGAVFRNQIQVALTLSDNRYFAPAADPFQLGPSTYTFEQWAQLAGEVGSTFAPSTFPRPDQTIETYMSEMGRTPSLEAFLAEARAQSRSNWRPEFSAQAVTDYIRAGFGLPPVVSGPCAADLNIDGVLNLNDMVAFQKWFVRQDMRADVNHDGALTTADVTAYESIFSNGCP